LSFVRKYVELENIMLSKISQTQKHKYHDFLSYAESGSKKKEEDKKVESRCKNI
jgi:hypothetical protein